MNITYADFQKLDLRVAEILEASVHPNADKLLLLKVRVGDHEKKIVAGIKLFYPPETLVGKKVIIVDNLEPAVIRGETSEGMLLAASDDSGLTLVTPERPISSGAKVK